MKTFESIKEWIVKNNLLEEIKIYKDKDCYRKNEDAIYVERLYDGRLDIFVEKDYLPEKLFDKVFRTIKKRLAEPKPQPIVISFANCINK